MTGATKRAYRVVLDILCLDGVWELTDYERVSYSKISESPNCTDCLDVETFQSVGYVLSRALFFFLWCTMFHSHRPITHFAWHLA